MFCLQDAFKRSKEFSDGKTFVPLQQNSQRVFSKEQEDHISAYTIKIAKMFYGLPTTEFRTMVYNYAVACNSKKIPAAWVEEKKATRDWYYAFMSRHPELKLKTPEGMSIARATAFNKVSVEIFFTAYTEAMEKYHVSPDRLFNLDETCLSTVLKPVKVVCEAGRPVASQVSQERGTTMTFVGIVNAAGHYIPPVFIIPRKRWNDSFMRGTIDGSKGILHQNGWMTGECFLETLQHVQAKTFCSVDNKIILIMDNAVCHLNIHAINYAIENGIVIVTLPPHTTSKLQPLDVSVYGPFKTYLRSLHSDFTLMHPNTAITEHMLPEFASKAWIRSATPTNILSGFSATGIWPINRCIFPDEAYAGAEVTERPPQDNGEELPNSGPALDADLSPLPRSPSQEPSASASEPTPGPSEQSASEATPGPSGLSASEATPGPFGLSAREATPKPSGQSASEATPGRSGSSATITPEHIRPFPKAGPRPRGKGRKKIRASILTENQEAIADMQAREDKKTGLAQKQKPKAKRRKTVPPVLQQESSSSDSEDDPMPVRLDDSSEYSDEVEDLALGPSEYPFTEKEVEVDDFVLVELEVEAKRESCKVCYVGKVLGREGGKYNISFLRSKCVFVKDTFVFPDIEDEQEVESERVIGVLVALKGTTKRQSHIIKIIPPLTSFNMR